MKAFIMKQYAEADPRNIKTLECVLSSTPKKIIVLIYDHLNHMPQQRRKAILDGLLMRYHQAKVHAYKRQSADTASVRLTAYYPKINGMVFECCLKDEDDNSQSYLLLFKLKDNEIGVTVHPDDRDVVYDWNLEALQQVRESSRNIRSQKAVDEKLLQMVEVGDIFGAITVGNGRTPITAPPATRYFQVMKIKGPNVYLRGIAHEFVGRGSYVQPVPNDFTEQLSIPYWLRVGTFMHMIDGDKKFLRCNIKGHRRQAYLFRKDAAGEYKLFFERAY